MPREKLNLKHGDGEDASENENDDEDDDHEQGKGLVLVNLNVDKSWFVHESCHKTDTQRDTNANAPPLAPQAVVSRKMSNTQQLRLVFYRNFLYQFAKEEA